MLTNNPENLVYLFKLVNLVRTFFLNKNFTEVYTPPVVENPGIEPHIHPFQVKSVYKNEDLPLYLQTSPEFWMKYLLSLGQVISLISHIASAMSQTHRYTEISF